jgi:hypothetical protein
MGGYRASTATHRIELTEFDGSDNWVDIKAARSSGDATRLLQSAAHITGIDGMNRPLFDTIDLGKLHSGLFQSSIVAWSLKGDDGDAEPMALTPANFDGLDELVGNWLAHQIQTYYQNRRFSEEQLKNSNGSSTAP